MKEQLLELIDSYHRRIKSLEEMLSQATDFTTKSRLETKRSVYEGVVRDLELLIKDEDES
jgi:hypothetical protein